jgi:tetratricopeptide (TPR) repeat protein
MAEYSFPIQDDLILPSPGAILTFDISPVSWLNIFAQGEYMMLQMENIAPANLFEGALGAGYEKKLSERITVGVDVTLGVYTVNQKDQSISGISSGVRTYGKYKLTPDQSILIHGGVKTHLSQPRSFMDSLSLGVGYELNLSEVIRNIARLDIEPDSYTPIFPVFYTWYSENTFAAVKITNNEENTIEDVQTSFFLEQYMEQPSTCSTIASLKPGESVLIPLTALFNEDMLELTENINTRAEVMVTYTSLGKDKLEELTLPIPIYHRNAMTWTDDRRAAAFVSARDPAALWFSKYAASVVRDEFRMGINNNMQYAMGVLETLNVYGINYVIDPTSVYSEMSSSQAIDFLQYPYQTLMYRGGDCDDLSILTCSLLEAIGIKTAFITIPGHIFMAFSLGMTEEEARKDFYDPEQLIYHENRAWVPLECTLAKEGFNKAWRVGAKQWRDAHSRGEAMIFPLQDSWKVYPPVSIPGAVSRFKLPEKEKSTLAFSHSLDRYIEREIRPQIRDLEELIAREDNAKNRNQLGILYGRYGMLGEAQEQFAFLAEQKNIHGWTNLGNIYFLKAEYKQGLSWYNKTLTIDPEDSVAILGMARCYYEMDDFSSSDYYYNQLIKYDKELGKEYGYLNSFFDTTGRAWSFSDRLSTTQWSMEEETQSREEKSDPIIPREEPKPDKGLTTMLSFTEKVPVVKPPEPVIEPEPVAEPEPEPEIEPEPVIIVPEPVVAPEPEAKPEPEPAVKPDLVIVPEPDVIPEPEVEPEPAVKPDPVIVPEPDVIPEPEVEPEPVVKPDPVIVPEPDVIPEPEVEPEPAVKPDPVIVPEPEVIPEPEVEPEPAVKSDPVIVPEPEVIPEPVSEPDVEEKPEEPLSQSESKTRVVKIIVTALLSIISLISGTVFMNYLTKRNKINKEGENHEE